MYKKILAPLDGSEVSKFSLSHIIAIATGCNTQEIVLFRVVAPIPSPAYVAYVETDGNWVASGDMMAIQKKQNYIKAETYLSQITEQLTAQGLNVSSVVATGRPPEAILDYAKDNNVDLIIMCTRGKSGFSRWLRGSVVGRVSRNVRIPIMTIPPTKKEGEEKTDK